jgi:hypothetical protein
MARFFFLNLDGCAPYKQLMRALGELARKGLPRGIPAEELELMLQDSAQFSSWPAFSSTVREATDHWPFLFSYPLMATSKSAVTTVGSHAPDSK